MLFYNCISAVLITITEISIRLCCVILESHFSFKRVITEISIIIALFLCLAMFIVAVKCLIELYQLSMALFDRSMSAFVCVL